ncbi:MAG: phosphatidylserine decarboxylase family protein [bacterium]|nr:phosphatidylserine decarboxylase family protein [bacterium]
MTLAREGWREMGLASLVCLGGAALAGWYWGWPAALPLLIVWAWVISFFRDPVRQADLARGEFCAPADGTVTEISHLEKHDLIEGPAVRIGIFLSIFNVHINRSPCAGLVRWVRHSAGRFLDARDPRSGADNESNTLLIVPAEPLAGPVVVRQVAGKIARRIICHAAEGDHLDAGARFGLIKFGSRTELIVPADGATVTVAIGTKVKAGETVIVHQAVDAVGAAVGDIDHGRHCPTA